MVRRLAILMLWLAAFSAMAKDGAPAADDAAVETRMLRLASELRCPVCQNQTLADSHADLAIDLRNQLCAMVKRGDTDAQILAHMTERYGDFVLYRPPVRASTWLLWFGPGVLLPGGVAALMWVIRRRQRLADDAFEPDPDEGRPPRRAGAGE